MAIYKGDTQLKAYKGDMQPVNIYKGNTKVAGWHPQTVSGEGTISLDGAFKIPPDALVVDGKCDQTGTPSPSTPAPITTITGDLTITAANGDLSDTVVTPLGSVELCSLPDGTKDEYDAVMGVLTKRVDKVVFDGSADEEWGLYNLANNCMKANNVIPGAAPRGVGNVFSDRFLQGSNPWDDSGTAGTFSNSGGSSSISLWFVPPVGVTTVAGWRTWLAANPIEVYYKLAEPYTIQQLTPALPVVRTGIKTLSVSANITPSFTATVKAMD